MVHLTLSNWNALYKELLRWQSLLEKSTLTKHIPYSRGTGTLYVGKQERMQGRTRREGSQHQARGGRCRKPSKSKSSDEEQEESSDADQRCSVKQSPWGSSKCCWMSRWREFLSCGRFDFESMHYLSISIIPYICVCDFSFWDFSTRTNHPPSPI